MTKLDVYTTDLYQRYQACYTAHHVMASSALGNKMHTYHFSYMFTCIILIIRTQIPVAETHVRLKMVPILESLD